MNTTLLLTLPTTSQAIRTTPSAETAEAEVRLELRSIVRRSARISGTRPQPLARALQQVVARHRADWKAPAAAVQPVADQPSAQAAPQPFHLVVPAITVAAAKHEVPRAGHPILRIGAMRRETN